MHWLQFRGPNASGIAPADADPPIHFSADTNMLWKTEILPGWSSPCIVNDRIFLTGFDESDSLLYTFALDRENGEVIWMDSQKPNDFRVMHPLKSYASPTVASNGEMIYASFPNYGLLAYDLDGKRAWEYSHETTTGYYYGGTSSPVVADSLVIVIVNSGSDPRIMALDCHTGHPAWIISAPDRPWASMSGTATPVIDGPWLILHVSQGLVAYDLLDQQPVWWLFTPTTGVGTPVIHDQMIYINTWSQGGEKKQRGEWLSFAEILDKCDADSNGKIEQGEISDDLVVFRRHETPDAPMSVLLLNSNMSFNIADTNKDKYIEEKEWNDAMAFIQVLFQDHGMVAIPLHGSGERPVSDIKWKVNEDTPETPSALAVSGNIFFIKDGGIVTVIDQGSGKVVFKDRIGAPGTYLSSPMLAGNRIYTCSFNGRITVLSADDFTVLAHNRLKEKIGASPVAVDDVLYVRTDKHMYAFLEK